MEKTGSSSIKAFTLVEVLVSMAITAIVLAIVFVIFSIMTQRMADYKNQNEPVTEMNRLTYAMNKDIFENGSMELSENLIRFSSYSGMHSEFEFSENYIVRKSEKFTDTFHLAVKKLFTDSISSPNKHVLYKRLRMQVIVNLNTVELKFYKRILADELLKAATK